jgi:NAD(P) transhydrogenase subunit alpha
MRISVVKEMMSGERRVGLTPETVGKLVKASHNICVETGAGERAGYTDDAYRAAGATIATDATEALRDAQCVVKVQRPIRLENGKHEVDLLPPGCHLVGVLRPASDAETVGMYANRGIYAFSMDLMPRITRAQAMDVNSSQATVAGYKAVMLAASSLPRFFPLLMTAAGTIRPATVFVIGAGVAGLQAIATARRLGAVVYAFDTRPAAKEHVESLRGKFVSLDLGGHEAEDAGGYAKALGEDLLSREQSIIARHLKDADVVISTAQVPGRPAPRLITDEAVFAMKWGSVIVDIAAENGGNCELTEPGKTVVRHDVTIVGPLNLPAEMPQHSSDMYSRNIAAFLKHLAPEGEPKVDLTDVITKDVCIAKPGEVLHEATRERLNMQARSVSEATV